jgi:hypothetical protein
MITLSVAATLLVIISLAAYHAIPPVRRVRGLFVLFGILCVGWVVSFTFLVMPTQAFSGRESPGTVAGAYVIGFTVTLFGALLMSLAVADVQASDLRMIAAGGGVGWIRDLSATIERTGDELFWVFSMSALLMPWAAGLGAAAIKIRSVASIKAASIG